MNSSEKFPDLRLSDIMHSMSPTPVPVDERDADRAGSATPRGASPEPATEMDALAIRHRLHEMGLWRGSRENLSSREKELVDMITRLVDPLPIDPEQLTRQAETISSLTAQRDYVLQQASEDRERWRYERETWDRTAEALLAQRARPPRVEEIHARERHIYDMEIRSLKQRLAESQRRQSTMETELRKLKPLLFIQPYFIPRQDKGKAREIPNANPNPDPETVTITAREPSVGGVPEPEPAPVASSSKLPPPPPFTYHTSGHHRRRTNRSSKRPPNPKGTPLSADAYSEHLLLAMRKVGRTRTAQVSGIIDYAEKVNRGITREINDRKEVHRNGTAPHYRRSMGDLGAGKGPSRVVPSMSAPPRTPLKSTVVHYGPSTTADNGVNTPIVFVHTNTPNSRQDPDSPQHTPVVPSSRLPDENGPPTPLDSLLDAARMMDDGAKRNNGKGKARARDEPESPLLMSTSSNKRQKLSVPAQSSARAGSSSAKLSRPRSALDVLADQAAAAFNESDQPEPQRRPRGRPKGSLSSAKSIARAREASRSASTSTSNSRSTQPITTTASGRPIRQTRRADSPVGFGATASAPPRGTGKPRGRPRGSTNASRVGASSARGRRVEVQEIDRDSPESEDDGEDEAAAAPSASIASEVLRHGFADATRFRLSATTIAGGSRNSVATAPSIKAVDRDVDMDARYVPPRADVMNVVSPNASKSPLATSRQQETIVPSFHAPDLYHVAAHPATQFHHPPQAPSSRPVTGLHPYPDAEAALNPMGSGGASAFSSAESTRQFASRAAQLHADRALDAEAEARHNLPRGSASDPLQPVRHVGTGAGVVMAQAGVGSGGWEGIAGANMGVGYGTNAAHENDADADGEHDVDAEGEMDVEEES